MPTKIDSRDVAAALYVAISLFVRRLRQTPIPGEVSVAEMAALGRLDRAGSIAPGELAKIEQVSPQAIGTTLSALEERGLVKRRPDPDDGRRIVMSLTPAGRRVVQNKRTARAEQLAKALERFTTSELETLTAAAPLIERLSEGI